jgi:hypothetical protein
MHRSLSSLSASRPGSSHWVSIYDPTMTMSQRRCQGLQRLFSSREAPAGGMSRLSLNAVPAPLSTQRTYASGAPVRHRDGPAGRRAADHTGVASAMLPWRTFPQRVSDTSASMGSEVAGRAHPCRFDHVAGPDALARLKKGALRATARPGAGRAVTARAPWNAEKFIHAALRQAGIPLAMLPDEARWRQGGSP